jgi:hypothetical protein
MTPGKRRPPRPLLRAERMAVASILRLLFFAALAIVGASWALVRHRTAVRPPMEVPVPAPTYDADAGEFPVPEVLD